MKTQIVKFPHCRGRRRTLMSLWITICMLVPVVGALAQSVFVPAPVLPEPEPSPVMVTDTNRYVSEVGTVPPEVPSSPSEPFKLGPVTLRPHVGYQFIYGNGIQSGPGAAQTTSVNEFSPGLRLDLGKKWTMDYTPIISLYSDSNFEDTVNHFFDLAGMTSYYDWTFRFGQKCAITTEPQVETATQTERQLYTTTLNAVYLMSSDMTLELGLNQEIQSVSGFTNSVGGSMDWSTMDWLNVHWGQNLAIAGGLGFGYEAVDVGSDMTYEQIQGRVTWRVARKINLSFNGGLEIRQFLGSTAADAINPIMGLSVEYHPFIPTTLTLTGERTVSTSYFQDQVVENARLSANLTQRLFKRLYLGLSGGYAVTDYTSTQSGTEGRTDDYSFFTVSLSATLFKRGLASIFYSTTENSSNQNGFSFSSEQVGFQLAYRY